MVVEKIIEMKILEIHNKFNASALSLKNRKNKCCIQEERLMYRILKEFERKTGTGVLVNISFNLHGTPLCTGKKKHCGYLKMDKAKETSKGGTL